VRDHTVSHQNAFFDIVDAALAGANASRDAEIRSLLDQWLQRPKRETYVDLSHTVPVCGSEACQPIPVPLRPTAEFLWQIDPFQLTGGDDGTIEGSGVDYILPYWMGRYYGVIAGGAVQSAAAPSSAVAPDSLASLFGANLAPGVAQAALQPLPLALGGVTLSVTDAAGATRAAPLVYVSPGQINFVVPDGTAPGLATLVTNAATTQTFTAVVQSVAPTLFSMNGAGSGVAAATAIRVQAANPVQQASVPVFQCAGSSCVFSADRFGCRYAGVRELLRHGHPESQFPDKRGDDHQRHQCARLVCGPGAGLHRPGSGQCRFGSQPARQRGVERGPDGRWAGGQHGHHQCSMTAQPIQLVHDSLPDRIA